MDNTWASPLYYKPFEHGVDVSAQAVTKYIAGHSDLVMGSVTCTEEAYPKLQRAQQETGICPSPDDVFLAMRGIRTLHVRLPHHMQAGLRVAEWLAEREEVAEVIHPALPGDPGHELWKRDFLGASSLFAFILKPEFSDPAGQAAMPMPLRARRRCRGPSGLSRFDTKRGLASLRAHALEVMPLSHRSPHRPAG